MAWLFFIRPMAYQGFFEREWLCIHNALTFFLLKYASVSGINVYKNADFIGYKLLLHYLLRHWKYEINIIQIWNFCLLFCYRSD